MEGGGWEAGVCQFFEIKMVLRGKSPEFAVQPPHKCSFSRQPVYFGLQQKHTMWTSYFVTQNAKKAYSGRFNQSHGKALRAVKAKGNWPWPHGEGMAGRATQTEGRAGRPC